MRRPIGLKAALLLLVAAACTGGNGQLASRFVKSVPVTASQGATITISSADEPELAGTVLVIPPGALAFDTTITLEVGEDDIVNGGASAGPVAIWGPSGLLFHTPARMTLPYELPSGRSEADLFIHVLEDDGTRFNVARSDLTVDSAKKQVQFDVNGFTAFQPGTTLAADGGGFVCSSNAQCLSNQVCQNGACTTQNANDAGAVDGGPLVCTSSAQCAPGQSCVNGACQGSNTLDGGCAFGACNNVDAGSGNGDGGSNNGGSDAGCALGTNCNVNDAGTPGGGTDAGSSGGADAGNNGGADAGCALGTTCALDAGSGPITCNSPADCGAFGQCVNGFCL